MTERSAVKLTYWPFLLADLIFIGLAVLIVKLGHHPLQLLEVYGLILSVGAGAFCFLMPFRTKLKMAESENLILAAEQIKNIELVAAQISSATTLWQGVQEESARAAAAAKAVTEQMTAEAQSFGEFLQKANDSEKAHLRLEVEKLRRGQGEWLKMLLHIFDHIYALHRGAMQSGQKGVMDQVSQFQNACRDAVRCVGLAPFEAEAGEAFDASKHQLLAGQTAAEGAVIAETLATGFAFQGQLVRPALVRLESAPANEPQAAPVEEVKQASDSAAQSQLL